MWNALQPLEIYLCPLLLLKRGTPLYRSSFSPNSFRSKQHANGTFSDSCALLRRILRPFWPVFPPLCLVRVRRCSLPWAHSHYTLGWKYKKSGSWRQCSRKIKVKYGWQNRSKIHLYLGFNDLHFCMQLWSCKY